MTTLGTYDVVIIGAGVAGASAGYFAARLGARVAMVEKGIPGQEASGRNAGGVRQQGRTLAELPLAMHSIRLWRSFRDERGGQFEYEQGGNLYLALNHQEVGVLQAAALRQRQHGLDVRHIGPAEVRALAPHLSDRVLAANYCATDGQANPILATRFILREAVRAGAALHAQTRVTRILVQDDRVTGVQTDRGRIACAAVILCGGAWSVELCRPLGVHLPILPRRTQVCVTSPLPPVLAQFVSGNTIYLRQTAAGNLLIGGGGAWEPLSFRKDTSFHSLQRFLTRAHDLLPVVAQTSVLRTWAGTLDITPDGAPLIGPIGGLAGLILAAGFTGHGFALGPAVGDVTARLALGMAPGVEISGLDPARFPPGLDFAGQYQTVAEPAP